MEIICTYLVLEGKNTCSRCEPEISQFGLWSMKFWVLVRIESPNLILIWLMMPIGDYGESFSTWYLNPPWQICYFGKWYLHMYFGKIFYYETTDIYICTILERKWLLKIIKPKPVFYGVKWNLLAYANFGLCTFLSLG